MLKNAIGKKGEGMTAEENTVCSAIVNNAQCRGGLFKVKVSRIEENLNHRKYQCEKCKRTFKFI